MLSFNVIQLRGTIFLRKTIGYSLDNEEKYKGLLPDSVSAPINTPSIQIGASSFQIVPDAKLEEGASWQLIARNTRIVFSPMKIDIITDIVAQQGAVESDFCTFCSKIFQSILEIESESASRIAFAPIYAKDRDEVFISQQLWDQQLRHTSFSGSNIEEVNITFNYRVQKSVGEHTCIINFKTIIGDAQKQLPSGEVITGCVTISLDINTAFDQNKQFSFSKQDVENFFSNVNHWGRDFLQYNFE